MRQRIALAAVAAAGLPGAASATTPSLYVADQGGGVSQFDIGAGGALAAKSPPTASGGPGSGTRFAAATPDGAHAYAAAGGAIYSFSVGPGGQLTALGSISGGTTFTSLAVSPDGSSLYAADNKGSGAAGALDAYDIGASGMLSPKSPGSVATGNAPSSVAVSPDGGSAYVVDSSSKDIRQFALGAGGAVPAGATTTQSTGTSTPDTIVFTPDGSSAYVTDNSGAHVLEYSIGPAGSLLPKSPGSVATAGGPTGIVVSPDGKSVYVSNSADASVSQYTVGADGSLSPKPDGPAPLVGGASPQQLAASPDGRHLYVPDAAGGHDAVYAYDIGAGGSLDRSSGRFVPAGSTPTAAIALPDQGPIASFDAAPGAPGSPTSFDARSSSDPDGAVAHFDWDFGDGSTALDAGPTPPHVYTQGTYTVTLTTFDDAICSTRDVYTGRTAYCNGGPGAVTTRVVTVGAGAPRPPVFYAGVQIKAQTMRVNKRGLGWISARCPRGTFGSCAGTITLRSKGSVKVPVGRHRNKRVRKLLLGQAGFNINPGKAVRIPVQVTKAARKVLRRRLLIRGRGAVVSHDKLMTSRKAAFSVRLKPARRPKKRR